MCEDAKSRPRENTSHRCFLGSSEKSQQLISIPARVGFRNCSTSACGVVDKRSRCSSCVEQEHCTHPRTSALAGSRWTPRRWEGAVGGEAAEGEAGAVVEPEGGDAGAEGQPEVRLQREAAATGAALVATSTTNSATCATNARVPGMRRRRQVLRRRRPSAQLLYMSRVWRRRQRRRCPSAQRL